MSVPKWLGTFGVRYLYAVFLKLEIITQRPADLMSWNDTESYSEMTDLEINPSIDLLTPAADDIIMEPQDYEKECAMMPRPKGSKNRKTAVVIDTVANIDEKIAAAEAAIAEFTETLKAKKAELKELTKAKVEAERLAAEKKAEEEKAKLMDAIAASGKSVDEIIQLLNGEQ